MNCRDYNESIMRYIDGTINDIEAAQMKLHFKSCKKCNEEFEELRMIFNTIEIENNIEPPSDFEARVMDKLKVIKPAWNKEPRVTMGFLYGFATFLLVLLLSMVTISSLGDGLLKAIGKNFTPLYAVNDFITAIGNVASSIFAVAVDLTHTLFRMAVVIAKAYYYILLLIFVVLFAIQWMFISLIKQNEREQIR